MGANFGRYLPDQQSNPIISGLMEAFSISSQLKQQAQEQETQRIRNAHESRLQNAEDVKNQLELLRSGAQPIAPDGTVGTNSQMPNTTLQGPSGNTLLSTPGANVQGRAPVEPGYQVNLNGQKYAYPTQMEQLQSQLQTESALSQAKNAAAADAERQKLEIQNPLVTLPPHGDSPAASVPRNNVADVIKGRETQDAENARVKDKDQKQKAAVTAFLGSDGLKGDALVRAMFKPGDPLVAPTLAHAHALAGAGADLPAINKVITDAREERARQEVANTSQANKIVIEDRRSGAGGAGSEATGTVANAIANYQQAPLSSFAMSKPQGQALMAEVMKANPDYHSQYYQTFQKTENDATTGKIGTSSNALNTMMGHLSVLNTASEALKNGNIQALNKLANLVGTQTGNNAQTTYDTIVHRLGPEVTKAYLASGGTVGERGTNEEDFASKLGPAQIKANIGVSAQLAASKIKALQDQYSRGTYGRGKQKLISDEADQARQTLTKQSPVNNGGGGGGGGTIRVTRKSDGKTGTLDPKDFDPAKYDKVQ